MKIAIVGAGPVGLEAAMAALDRGYEVCIYERGQIADAVRQWGHVRMFSPFEMNVSKLGLGRLHLSGIKLPRLDTLLTGAEFRESYLLPLARSLATNLCENCTVLAIGRSRRLKGDFIADPQRGAAPFRLLLRDSQGERIALADIVLDCSGTFLPIESPRRRRDSGSWRSRRFRPDSLRNPQPQRMDLWSALPGGGFLSLERVIRLRRSCATSRVARQEAEIIWLIRNERTTPVAEVPDDPLPERSAARRRIESPRRGKPCRPPLRTLRSILSDRVRAASRFAGKIPGNKPISLALTKSSLRPASVLTLR